MKLTGYIRPDGKVGFRNTLLIIPSVVCSLTVSRRIADSVEGSVLLENHYGCAQVKPDLDLTGSVLSGMGSNPNVGAVLVVGLGCEGISPENLAEKICRTGKPVRWLTIQDCGNSSLAFCRGVELARELMDEISSMERVEVPLSSLTLAVENGGSDATSGLASNPVAGFVADSVIGGGGTVIIGQTTEYIGAEHVLVKRASSPEVASQLLDMVHRCEKRTMDMGCDLRGCQPTPGNIAGGISSIEEKSLGCLHKSGHHPIEGILSYSEKPSGKGLYIMDTPGQDIEASVGMVSGGAQIVLFTTGLGTPTGSPVAPTYRITANERTWNMMGDDLDCSVSSVLSGEETVEKASERVFKAILDCCNGELTASERGKFQEFGIFRLTGSI